MGLNSLENSLPAAQSSDAEWVARAQAGDLGAFEALVSRYEGRVYGLAMRMLRQPQDAEDVTQQTFISAIEHLPGFRGDANFSTWLFRIATHAALKLIRKRNGLRTVPIDTTEGDATEDFSGVPHPQFIADWRHKPDELAGNQEVRALLDKALADLDEKHRVVFELRDIQGFSIKEVAEALDLSEANVKVRLLRARLALRERLTAALGDPATQVRRVHNHD
jgi:RNA polymerase sigma-70 factor (ECF subfamily)